MPTILVVDDEKSIRESIKMILEYNKYSVSLAEDGNKAIGAVSKEHFDAILLDIKMPGKDGIEVLQEMKQSHPNLPIIIISGHGTFDDAIKATRLGAFDYLAKPLDRDRLLVTVRNALEHRRLTEEIVRLRDKDVILGESPQIKEIHKQIQRVGQTDARVLITGESGTGKELVARAIHKSSKRASCALVEVNCAAIPAELIESELFGHEKGSFTGATTLRIGKFEQSDGGTLFLDEIGDMSLSAQAKMLRALEEGKIERVGGTKAITVNVRVIAATNKNLPEQISKGKFREDLYHRLNVILIHIPPLRERKEDIPTLAAAFARETCSRYGYPLKIISGSAMNSLTSLEWSGNVRELRNSIERLVIMTPGDTIETANLHSIGLTRKGEIDDLITSSQTFQEFKDKAEAAYIRYQLERNNWNVSKTAETLEMERSHLYTKIKRYGLERGKEIEETGE